MDESNSLTIDDKWFRTNFSGTNLAEVYVNAPVDQGMMDPERFALTARFQDSLVAFPEVDSAVSLVDLMRKMHFEMTAGRDGEGALPGTRYLLAQYLLLFESSGGEELDRLIDFERRTMRIGLRINTNGARATRDVGLRAEALAKEFFHDETRVEVSGLLFLIGYFFEEILGGQTRGLLITSIVIMLMMMVSLRSVRAGALSMIPNLLPLLVLGGWLGATTDHVDSDVLIIAIIAIGIGVDDTIHFLMRYRIEVGRNDDHESAVRNTFAYSGRAILMTTVILVCGFVPCASSSFAISNMLGTLLPMCLVIALAADILLVPAMIKLGWLRMR